MLTMDDAAFSNSAGVIWDSSMTSLIVGSWAMGPAGKTVLLGDLPLRIADSVVAYVRCIAGASKKGDYLEAIRAAGFVEVKVAVDAKKKCPKQPPPLWFPPRVLSASAYSGSVLRPPTSCSIAWDNINTTTSINSLSNLRS
jgi:hypothetical protein